MFLIFIYEKQVTKINITYMQVALALQRF